MAKSDDKIIMLLVLLAIPIYIIYIIFEFIAQIFAGIYSLIVENKELTIGIVLFSLIIFIGILVYPYLYFRSKKFKILKKSISEHILNCNDLNHYIEELKNSYSNLSYYDYGEANLKDNSIYNYSRNEWHIFENGNNIYNCSASVCKNASNQPIKYLCKYFDIKKDQKSLEKFEKVLNDFLSVENGLELLYNEKLTILNNISSSVPVFIEKFHNERLSRELGFEFIDLSDSYIPIFKFQYISAGGYSSTACDIELNIENLNKLIQYLNDEIKWRKSIAGQRALMTTHLREEIKKRDKYICCNCGNGTEYEPNLLLEIDHIIPVSKGGLTTVKNLQTLCWKCNRSKGAKVKEYNEIIE